MAATGYDRKRGKNWIVTGKYWKKAEKKTVKVPWKMSDFDTSIIYSLSRTTISELLLLCE